MAVTLGLDGETETLLRRLAKERHKDAKGAMARTVKEGLEGLEKDSARKKAWQRILARIKKGYHLGGLKIKSRDELYDRFDRH